MFVYFVSLIKIMAVRDRFTHTLLLLVFITLCSGQGHSKNQSLNKLGGEDVCKLPYIPGRCRSLDIVNWFYDYDRNVCVAFMYGGCSGNANRFSTKAKCEDKCLRNKKEQQKECSRPSLKYCPNVTGYYYVPEQSICARVDTEVCLDENHHQSEEECERRCGRFKGLDVCRYLLDPGPCNSIVRKVYWNQDLQKCEWYDYGGCLGGPNRFSTIEECQQICTDGTLSDVGISSPPWRDDHLQQKCILQQRSRYCHDTQCEYYSLYRCDEPQTLGNSVQDTCTLPALTGECADYRERWYYDTADKRCRQFYFGGCGGNGNNFGTERECEMRCTERVVTTTSRPSAPEPFRQGVHIPSTCIDAPLFANCKLIVTSNFCRNKYYSKFCCRSCMEAGQLRPEEMQVDQLQFTRK